MSNNGERNHPFNQSHGVHLNNKTNLISLPIRINPNLNLNNNLVDRVILGQTKKFKLTLINSGTRLQINPKKLELTVFNLKDLAVLIISPKSMKMSGVQTLVNL